VALEDLVDDDTKCGPSAMSSSPRSKYEVNKKQLSRKSSWPLLASGSIKTPYPGQYSAIIYYDNIYIFLGHYRMDTDPGIVCFQHCGAKVFCQELPGLCPQCKTSLEIANFKIMPFRVPYPFVRAKQHPCSVIIKPTTGDFLK